MSEKKNFKPENYDPVEYWSTRDQPNTGKKPGVSASHADFFNLHCRPKARILEAGPGIGRLFPLYHDAKDKTFTTIDLTNQHEKTVAEAAAAENLSVRQNFIDQPDAAYPFEDGEFDLAVSSYVLIHVPFAYIDFTMKELARVAKRVIVFASTKDDNPKNADEQKPHHHVFAHDYEEVVAKNGLKIYDRLELKSSTPGVTPKIFVYGRA